MPQEKATPAQQAKGLRDAQKPLPLLEALTQQVQQQISAGENQSPAGRAAASLKATTPL